MAWLLDVNSLVALLDPDHVHHEAMHAWFGKRRPRTWASCPLTENGLIRVLAQPAYPGGPFPPGETIERLHTWKARRVEGHELWADEVSLTDAGLFRAEYIVAPRQVADVYLLGLAYRRKSRLVSFDRHLAWEAVQGATSDLIKNPVHPA